MNVTQHEIVSYENFHAEFSDKIMRAMTFQQATQLLENSVRMPSGTRTLSGS